MEGDRQNALFGRKQELPRWGEEVLSQQCPSLEWYLKLSLMRMNDFVTRACMYVQQFTVAVISNDPAETLRKQLHITLFPFPFSFLCFCF